MDSVAESFKKLSTSTISDALDKLGITGQCLGVKPLDRSFRTVGRAFTVKYGPVGITKGTVGDYIDDVNEGELIVLDNDGKTDCTVWGDILTTVAHHKRIAGTVIHGVCRDSELSLKLAYPIFSLDHYMRTGKDRVQVEGVNVPVSFGNVRISPGDLLVGDADGVVVIPAECEEKVLSVALEIEKAEDAIRAEVEQGATLGRAREKFNYHRLQSKS